MTYLCLHLFNTLLLGQQLEFGIWLSGAWNRFLSLTLGARLRWRLFLQHRQSHLQGSTEYHLTLVSIFLLSPTTIAPSVAELLRRC
jgi:hypothetical protein